MQYFKNRDLTYEWRMNTIGFQYFQSSVNYCCLKGFQPFCENCVQYMMQYCTNRKNNVFYVKQGFNQMLSGLPVPNVKYHWSKTSPLISVYRFVYQIWPPFICLQPLAVICLPIVVVVMNFQCVHESHESHFNVFMKQSKTTESKTTIHLKKSIRTFSSWIRKPNISQNN